MLGSLQDAEDALQETLLRAWRHLDDLTDQDAARAWLYRIATNPCLTMQTASARRRLDLPLDPLIASMANSSTAEATSLQPFPDRQRTSSWPSSRPSGSSRPVSARSFSCATCSSGPPQRPRTSWRRASPRSTARCSAPERPWLGSARGDACRASHRPAPPAAERDLVDRFVAPFRAADVEAFVALLREDALLTMPPYPAGFEGPAACIAATTARTRARP